MLEPFVVLEPSFEPTRHNHLTSFLLLDNLGEVRRDAQLLRGWYHLIAHVHTCLAIVLGF